MKLMYRIAMRLALVLLPLMAIWAGFFYFRTLNEVNDETDDALDEFTDKVIARMLSGQELPSNVGANIIYDIIPIGEQFAQDHPSIRYYFNDEQFPSIGREPARVLTTVFRTDSDNYYLLKAYTPTIDKQELMQSTLVWIVILYFSLLLTVILVTILVFYRNMRPLYRLLGWLDRFRIGAKNPPLDNPTDITEFQKLNVAAEKALNRYEEAFEAQKEFIGNASHELQTPLAVMGNRIEWLLDNTELDERQIGELLGIQRTLGGVVIPALVQESVEVFSEIYEDKDIEVDFPRPDSLVVRMNESLARTLTGNLLKNAFIYTPHGRICISIKGRTLEIANTGETPLDADHIFDRFYKSGGREGSLGLGLAIVGAVQRYYDLEVKYRFEEKMHIFSVKWR